MASPILARADALMQRRRPSGDADEIPILTDAVDSDDDIPVLFDVEAPEAEAVDIATEPPPPVKHASPPLDPALLESLTRELARRVERRLIAELPHLIEATVRDFLDEQDGNSER